MGHGCRMPWSPGWPPISDPRLDPYRDQVAVLERDGVTVGHVLILTEGVSTQIGGLLWWRRWATQELPWVFVGLADGVSFEIPVSEEELADALLHWDRDQFRLSGELVTMRWLTQDEAIDVAPRAFGVTWCLDNYDQVIWSWPDE